MKRDRSSGGVPPYLSLAHLQRFPSHRIFCERAVLTTVLEGAGRWRRKIEGVNAHVLHRLNRVRIQAHNEKR